MYIDNRRLKESQDSSFKVTPDVAWEDQPCAVIEGIRKQNEGKPWWLRSNSIMISCSCPRCTVIC